MNRKPGVLGEGQSATVALVGSVLFATVFGIFLLSADAQSWVQTSAPATNWQALACSADGTKVVATFNGGIYTSTDFGANWRLAGNAPVMSFPSVASSEDGTKVVVVSNINAPGGPSAGPIYVSLDSGTNWTQTGAPLATWIAVASSADGTRLVAIAQDGRVYTSPDSGGNWGSNTIPNQHWSSVASSADGTHLVLSVRDPGGVYYPTNSGIIYSSTNSGATWVSNSVPNMFWGSVAASADGRKLVGVCENGILNSVYTSADSGLAWASNNVPAGKSGAVVASSADGNKLAAAVFGGGSIYTSADGGNHWTQTDAPKTDWKTVVSSADGSRLLAAATRGGLYTSYSTPAPLLSIARAGADLSLSWIIPSTNFVMQQSPDLTSWAHLTNAPRLNLTNLQNEIMLSAPNGRGFYRLATP